MNSINVYWRPMAERPKWRTDCLLLHKMSWGWSIVRGTYIIAYHNGFKPVFQTECAWPEPHEFGGWMPISELYPEQPTKGTL